MHDYFAGLVPMWQCWAAASVAYGIGLFTFVVWALCAIGRDPIPDPFDEMAEKVDGREPFVARPEPMQLSIPDPPRRRRSQLIDAREVAKRMGVSRRFVYDHWKEWPFAIRLGPNAIRFDKGLLREWMAQRKEIQS